MASIMIVDDSKISRAVLKGIFEDNGHTVIAEAVNGKDALEKISDVTIDIITLDITMPVMDGIEALKQIKKKNPEQKIIMVTAAGQKDKIMEAVKCGASEFLTKPFDAKKILESVEKLEI